MDSGTTISRRQRNYTLGVLVLVFTSSHIDRQIVAILGQPIKEALAMVPVAFWGACHFWRVGVLLSRAAATGDRPS